MQDLAYGYDAADGVSSITDSLATASSQTFGYDNRRRLTDTTGAYGDIDYSMVAEQLLLKALLGEAQGVCIVGHNILDIF